MKNILLLIILNLSAQFVVGQSNLELGTKWTYSQNTIGGQIEPSSVEIVGDTLFNNTNWYLLEGLAGCASNGLSQGMIREENSTWIYYNSDDQSESTLYDFSLNSGDSYIVEYFGAAFPIEVNIDSTSSILINGIERKIQFCSNPNSDIDGLYFGNQIIEGIGSLDYLFPQGNICDPHAGPIRCLQNSIEFIDFDEDRECDDFYFSTNTSETLFALSVELYPNPVFRNQNIKIQSNIEIEKISIIDPNGIVLKTEMPKSKAVQIKLSTKGIYYIKIESRDNVCIKKIVVVDE